MIQQKCFGNYWVRINPEEVPQVSWDDGETWEDIDMKEAVDNIVLEMGGQIVKQFHVTPPNILSFTGDVDVTKWE